MERARFEWDEEKNIQSQLKHGLSFEVAQYALADPKRVVAEDLSHSGREKRYFCFGKGAGGIITVRFTYRDGVICIFGAGYWRKGRKIYEEENKINQ